MFERPAGVPFPPIPVNPALRSIRYENCTSGLSAFLFALQPLVDPAVPSAFSVVGWPPGFSDAGITARHCDRVVLPNQVLLDFNTLEFSVLVGAENNSWETEGVSFYIFDHLVSSPEVAAFYQSMGIPAEVASFEIGTLPVLGEGSETWVVTKGETKFSFEFALTHQPGDNRTATNYRWYGKGPFLRADMDLQYTYHQWGADGVLRMEGPSQIADILKAPVWEFIGNAFIDSNSLLTVNPQIFRG